MKRPFGQHFLFDPNILRKIVTLSGVTRKDTVVEIGPGLGRMTGILAENAKRVIAIEFDKRLIERLQEELSEKKNVEIIQADALKFPYEDIKGDFRVVANIPYYITTPIIFKLLEYKEKMPGMTLLMQKEVAKRITASEGSKDYGVLSITSQLYTEPKLLFTVSRKAFSPPPKVDSAAIHFKVSKDPRFKMKDEALFLDIVRSSFSQRRKMIMSGLRKFEGIGEALERAGIDPTLRPGVLSIKDFVRLSDNIKEVKLP